MGLTAIDRISFARPIESYQLAEQDVTFEFYASLTGVGLLYYQRSGTTEILLGGGAVDISMLNFKSNSAYQNTAEFIAVILRIRGLRQLGISTRSISLRGDSITALKWAESGKFKGEVVDNAAVTFILQSIYENISVSKVTHLSAEDNWRSEYLSRV